MECVWQGLQKGQVEGTGGEVSFRYTECLLAIQVQKSPRELESRSKKEV